MASVGKGRSDHPVINQLADNIYRIESAFGHVFVRTYIIVGENAAVIDTGLSTTGRAILDCLSALGSPRVGAVIHTHGHWDHIGSAAMIRESTECPIAVHFADADMVSSHAENDRRFLRRFPEFVPGPADVRGVHKWLGPEIGVDIKMTGSESFDMGRGVVLKVIPMPGHTPGCIGIYDEASGTLFTGDSLPGDGPFGTLAQYEDVAAYRKTLSDVMQMPVKKILTGHFDVIEGDDVGRFLSTCNEEIDRIENCVLEMSKDTHDLIALTKKVCRKLKKPFMLQPLMTVTAHLQDLANRDSKREIN